MPIPEEVEAGRVAAAAHAAGTTVVPAVPGGALRSGATAVDRGNGGDPKNSKTKNGCQKLQTCHDNTLSAVQDGLRRQNIICTVYVLQDTVYGGFGIAVGDVVGG